VKPIDAVTGLPRAQDAARETNARMRQGETQFQNTQATFAKEIEVKSRSVSEPPKAREAKVESDSKGRQGAYSGDSSDRKKRRDEETQSLPSHPVKGKILDIRGA